MISKLLLATALASPAVSASSFDWKTGNVTLYHSQNTYCNVGNYETMTYEGMLEGFVPTYTINDPSHDTHGYIGYHEGQQTIYVAYRGSESIQNWIDNLDAILTDYPYCDGCDVHKGFYSAQQDCYDGVLSEVKKLQSQFPSYTVMTTGHSLGAALALLTALELKNSGIQNVELFNFGSPRVGDTSFSEYASSSLSHHSRVTHHKDMVVHVPMHERFTHINGEWYQPGDDLYVQECVGAEDKDCSYQWHITSISDHLFYLGLPLGESNCDGFDKYVRSV